MQKLPGQHLWQRFLELRFWRHPGVVALGVLPALVLAGGLVRYATARWGPGANSDGLTYLVMARYIARAGVAGYPLPDSSWKVVTHFPPGYPLLMALLSPLTRSEADAALVVNLVSLVLVVGLGAREVFRATRHAFPTWATALWLAAAFPLLRIFAWVFSEAPFLAVVLLISWAMDRWLADRRPWAGVLVGLLVAWGVYLRWLGVALVPWAWLLAWRHFRAQGASRSLWKRLIPFGVAAGTPIVVLFVSSRWVEAGAAAGRVLRWHPPDAAKWWQAVETLHTWISPPFVTFSTEETLLRAGGGLLALVLLSLLAWRLPSFTGKDGEKKSRLFRWWSFLGIYFLTLLTAMTLLDAETPMDWRLLSPIFLGASLLFGIASWEVLARMWPTALLLAWIWVHLMRTQKVYDEFFLAKWHRIGAVLRSEVWQQADVWPWLRRLPDRVVVMTNEDIETRYYADRPVWPLHRPLWREGRAYWCDSVRNECFPLPYTHPQAWAEDLARRAASSCTVIVLIHLSPSSMTSTLLRELEPYFPRWKQLNSGYLLRSPTCPDTLLP